jgi:hypothetical protein
MSCDTENVIYRRAPASAVQTDLLANECNTIAIVKSIITTELIVRDAESSRVSHDSGMEVLLMQCS